ncbi:hypothetical protein SAMN04487761_1318 [Lachnospiraceae bacterium C7]|nr:hypothetical protein SAMN04487761_1318 [Lachnospiraceae bacterium C7]
MSTFGIISLVIIIILLAILIALYFMGKKAQAKKEEQDKLLAQSAQSVNLLIIDKGRMKLKDSGLPQVVINQANGFMKRTKVPIVKAKVGNRVTTFIADEKIFDAIPTKKEVKASVSGLYITNVRGLRGPIEQPKKKGFRAKLLEKYNKASDEVSSNKKKTKNK